MRYVNSGNGKIPLITLVAILSISLTVNLPGLAVSPLLGKLRDVMPHVTELESQLLVVLPNFVIIPFILFSGKLCTLNNQIRILVIGLSIYILSGVAFLFADNMLELILLSCMLGVGCGLCIPLAASLIAQNFSGEERTKQLGFKSGLSNLTVIFATLFVGWIAAIGWHLAFLVYLIPVIPLCLVPFLTRGFIKAHSIVDKTAEAANATPQPETPEKKTLAVGTVKRKSIFGKDFGVQYKRVFMLLIGVIGLYVALTYCTMVISDFLPFTMKHYGMNTSEVGIATAMFYLAATCAGFLLTRLIRLLKGKTPYLALILCVGGLYACGFVHTYLIYVIAIFLIGFGYGILQPIIYDKTAYVASTPEKSTEYFGYTLTGNYIAIGMVPFVIDFFARIFSCSTINFPYIFNASILLAILVIGFFKSRSFVFSMIGAGGNADKQS